MLDAYHIVMVKVFISVAILKGVYWLLSGLVVVILTLCR